MANQSPAIASNLPDEQDNTPKTQREWFAYGLGVVLSLLHLYFNVYSLLPDNYIASIHLAGFGILCVLMFPSFRSSERFQKLGFIIDLVLMSILVVGSAYLILYSDALADRGYSMITSDMIMALLTIVVATEIVRRSMGWTIPILIILGLGYVLFFGKHISGVFHFGGLSLETVLYRNYFDDGLFGNLANISWQMVFIFILFGAFLVKSGAGDFMMRLSQAAVGRFTGGSGLVAVMGSGLMGSVSGSAIANTTATGVITIPMMIRAGFPPKFAAAVEAGASTGGQIIPPVMGAGVFIMVAYTQIPFLDIIAVAFLPGLLYFITIGIYVRIQAKRSGILPNKNQSETVWQVLKAGWHHLLPLFLLVGLLVWGKTPTYAGGFATISVVLFSWVSKERMSLKQVLDALAMGAKNCATIAVLLVAIGVFVNAITMSGLSVTFSQMITEWAGSSLLLMLALVAVASLVVGMGLPVTVSYIVLAALCAPALYALIAQNGLVDVILQGNIPESAKTMVLLLSPELADILNAPVGSLTPAAVEAAVQTMPVEVRDLLLEQSFDPHTLSMMLLSAHMIIFWLSQDSNVTPPVCLVAFAAANIAKTPPMATGFEAWKTAKGLYIMPVLFAYTGFIGGSWAEVFYVFGMTAVGFYAFVASLYGYLEYRQAVWQRVLLLIVGLILIWPNLPILIDVAALLIFGLLLAFDIRQHRNHSNPQTA